MHPSIFVSSVFATIVFAFPGHSDSALRRREEGTKQQVSQALQKEDKLKTRQVSYDETGEVTFSAGGASPGQLLAANYPSGYDTCGENNLCPPSYCLDNKCLCWDFCITASCPLAPPNGEPSESCVRSSFLPLAIYDLQSSTDTGGGIG